jgi:hypothetical protein
VKFVATKKDKKNFNPLFCCYFWILDPRSEIRDGGWGMGDGGWGMGKNQDLRSGINIPDPQHWLYVMTVLYIITDATSGSEYEQHLQILASSLL